MVCVLLIVILLSLKVSSQDDPCYNYRRLYDDGGRSINCDLYYSESHDRFIAEGWRRVQLQPTGEDLTMPSHCVPRGYCGSHSNVWLNGTHPTVEDGIVDRMGCLSMFSSCCKIQYPIQIKNCTDYMVYNLMRTFGSDERYCFGDSTLCYKTSSTTTVSPTTKMSHPNAASSTTKKAWRTDESSTRNTYEGRPIATVQTNPEISSSVDNNHQGSQKTTTNVNDHDEYVFAVRDYETGDTRVFMILVVCLSIILVLLIILVVGISFFIRQRKTKKLSNGSAPTNPAIDSRNETHADNTYDSFSPQPDDHGYTSLTNYLVQFQAQN